MGGDAAVEKKFLGTHEVARILSVDAGTVIRWADAGQLAHFRTPGGHRRILREDVLRFVRERRWPCAMDGASLKEEGLS